MEFEIFIEDIKQVTTKRLIAYANKVRKKMMQYAKHELSPNVSKQYIGGLSEVTVDKENEVSFQLNGFLPVALEVGIDAFDIKPGLLRSPKAKIAQDGSRYIRVPLMKADRRKKPVIRTVSSKSDAMSWIHPGLESRNFFDRATEEIE